MTKYKIPLITLGSFICVVFLLIITLNHNHTVFVSPEGSDNNNGTRGHPLRTIQHAADLATPGTTIRILPGIYRESVEVRKSGTKDHPIRFFVDPKDRGKVILSGSEPSRDMKWALCTPKDCPGIPSSSLSHVYYTTLNWTEIPQLLYEQTTDGVVHELHIARSPNYEVTTPWKYHEHWWTAQDSIPNQHILTDRQHLTNTGDLTGATAYMMDGADRCGSFLYTKTIDQHYFEKSELYFSDPVGFSIFGSHENGIGPLTKYYIEGKSQLLDVPGEWLFDEDQKKLYLWPLDKANPDKLNIEIARRTYGMAIAKSSNIEVDGLVFNFINGNPDLQSSYFGSIYISPKSKTAIRNLIIKNSQIKYSNTGITITTDNPGVSIDGIKLKKNVYGNILKNALLVAAPSDVPSNIRNLTISDSEFYKNAYYYNDIGINIARVSNIRITNNYIHDTATYGIHVTSYEKNKDVVKNVQVEGNRLERVCQNMSACGAIKFYGGKFEDTWIKNNIIRENTGWSYCQDTKWGGGFAHGVFISNASGIKVEGNISMKNTGAAYTVYPRQIEAVNNIFSNNLAAYSFVGMQFSNPINTPDYDENVYVTRHDGTAVENNVFYKNGIGIEIDPANTWNISLDYNGYIENQRDMKYKNIPLQMVSDIRNNTRVWDLHSLDAGPQAFKNASQNNFNVPYLSALRGRGEPKISNDILQMNLYLLGLSSDIGPCKYRLIGNSCPARL